MPVFIFPQEGISMKPSCLLRALAGTLLAAVLLVAPAHRAANVYDELLANADAKIAVPALFPADDIQN